MSKLRIDQVNEESLRLYKFGSDDIAYSFDLTKVGKVFVRIFMRKFIRIALKNLSIRPK